MNLSLNHLEKSKLSFSAASNIIFDALTNARPSKKIFLSHKKSEYILSKEDLK